MSNKKKPAKRKKFRKITFKFSKQEYDILQKCAQLESTTINKFVKGNIRNGINEMMPRLKTWLDQLQPENQLKLFTEEPDEDGSNPAQISMMEEYKEFYRDESQTTSE